MKNYTIDWTKLTEEEAQEIMSLIQASFNVVAKIKGDEKFHDIRYLETRDKYDDNYHGDK